MKELSTIIFSTFFRGLGVVVLCTFAAVGTAFADNITKTFEFGEGTSYTRSNVRTFNIPCGTLGGIAAVVKFQRLGPSGANNDIPIIIELREPDTAANQEGPIAKTESGMAKLSEQTETLFSPSSTRGCSLPWRVRVKYANDGTAPVKAFGTIRLDFDGRSRDGSRGYVHVLKKGTSGTVSVGDSVGFMQGIIRINANWTHYIAGLAGPNPIELRVQLINPNGTVVKTVEGYSSNEARSELQKFELVYQIANHVPGQWKLKFTNNTDDDANMGIITTKFTPGCP